MRRIFIAVLALTLPSVGSLPAAACALASAKLAGCGTPKPASGCHRMKSAAGHKQIASKPDQSCCFAAPQIPPSDSRYKTSGVSLSTAPLMSSDPLETVPKFDIGRSTEVLHDLSPPALQPLLCTFLI